MGKYLTRRANQRHSFIIAQSVKRTPGRAMAATAVNVKLILPPRQSRGSPASSARRAERSAVFVQSMIRKNENRFPKEHARTKR